VIDASVLRRMRVVTGIEAAKSLPPGWRFGKATCQCGDCRKCRNREWMRQARANERTAGPSKRGPKMDEKRRCLGCGGRISRSNESGFCGECHHGHRPRRIGHVAQRRQWFSHGGGI
jgi:hypothetical protein